MPTRPDIYLSADVEADGPIPGPYSMLSFGLAVAGTFDGTSFVPVDPTAHTFYAELRPISDGYNPDALAVSGLDRDRLLREGRDPAEAMNAAAAWIRQVAGDHVPVFVAFPLSFDWLWMYWYFMRYADEGSPFGHSRCIDLKTTYAIKAGVPITQASKVRLPRSLRARRPHTHHALDDAIEQAELAANLLTWDGRSGPPAGGPP
ncbi:hypothetical protein [Actinopolymorpha alba]|uniref:hypothetical protein n=1 Tax=Actinopolymorpha alba TaxID=533267 RepID=UPI00035F6BC1|nr:hypothetical protein [Actinopolymorpha alba]